MRPKIEDTWFGSITVEGTRYEHDIIIRLSGKVRRRNKQLSKAQYGTSHTISLDEIRDLHRKRAERVIIGSGQEGKVALSPEAEKFLEEKGCRVDLLPTPEAVACWNEAEGEVLGLFHITC
ncbi:MAG: Mth938-like domain-containing protein [Bacteroidota bacterium]